MDKKIIIGVLIVLVIIVGWLFLSERGEKPIVEEEVFSMAESREIAGSWVVNNAPTYVFDGFDLELVSEEELLEGELYSFVFSFQSRAAGYGDRTDEMVAQVITSHVMEVAVGRGKVISAITDEVYDEIRGEMVEGAFPETIKIDLYFVQIVDGQEEIFEVERSIPYTVAVGRAAIEELLRGPLPYEEAEGFSTAINEGTELQSIDIQDGAAFVDFNERLQEGVAGSARVMAIRNQIEKTLLQFDTVDEVVISIDGETEYILQP